MNNYGPASKIRLVAIGQRHGLYVCDFTHRWAEYIPGKDEYWWVAYDYNGRKQLLQPVHESPKAALTNPANDNEPPDKDTQSTQERLKREEAEMPRLKLANS